MIRKDCVGSTPILDTTNYLSMNTVVVIKNEIERDLLYPYLCEKYHDARLIENLNTPLTVLMMDDDWNYVSGIDPDRKWNALHFKKAEKVYTTFRAFEMDMSCNTTSSVIDSDLLLII